jgi:hypothetical protein
MAIRTLCRRVIIREYDFKKVKAESISIGFASQIVLYDRMTFTPLNEDALEKIKLLEVLKGKTGPLTEIDWDLKRPQLLVYQLRDYLYNDRYYHWRITADEEGYVCVQARKNTPKSRIGWGVFEKDLESRL